VNAIETDPRRPDRVWVATDIGVFQSKDRGANWSCFGRGLPRALAVDLVFHPRLRLLRVGTRGRGVWEIEIT
jgi:ligand-binding sensor domain-containing protein